MIYRLPPHLRLWDTWMFKEGDEYHLFILTQPKGLKYWDRVCHAVSRDLINWEGRNDILLEEKEDKAAWDAGVILTGSTFRCDEGYGMTYGAVRHGGRVQRIGLLFSKDLETWEKCPSNPVLSPKSPYYEENPEDTTESSVAWRDAYITRVEGGYEALIAANDASNPKTVNGCVARAFSSDLIHWELLPPMASPCRYVDMEVPQYFELNGFHYLLFTTGTSPDLPSRIAPVGTYYLAARQKYGEYRIPEDNMLIGSGESRADCIVGKVIFTGEGPLLYHHIVGKRTAFAAPKKLCQDGEGRIWVERWEGLDALVGEDVCNLSSAGRPVSAQNNIAVGEWRVEGEHLAGDAGPSNTAWLFENSLADCVIRARIEMTRAERAGVLFHIGRVEEPHPHSGGLALCLDRKRGVIQLCEAQTEWRKPVRLKALDNAYLNVGESVDVEIFLRAEYVEIYCDGRPHFVLNAADYPTQGKAGFFVDNGKVVLSDIAVRALPTMQ